MIQKSCCLSISFLDPVLSLSYIVCGSLAPISRTISGDKKEKRKKEKKNANTRDYQGIFLFSLHDDIWPLPFLQERVVDLFTTVDWRDKCQHRTSRNDQAQFTRVLVSVLVCGTQQ